MPAPLSAEALLGLGRVLGAAMEAMLVWRLALLKPCPGVFSKISYSVRLGRAASEGGLAEGPAPVRRAEALVGRGWTEGGLRLATGAMADLTGGLLLGVEFREAVARTGGVHGNPRRSIAAFDILGDTIGSITEAGTGRARKV